MKYLLAEPSKSGSKESASTNSSKTSETDECAYLLLEENTVAGFIKAFANLPAIEEITTTGKDKYSYTKLYKSYFGIIRQSLFRFSESKYPFFKEKKAQMYFHIALYVQQTLYSRLFASVSSEEDVRFYERCRAMQGLDPKVFQVKGEHINEQMLEIGLRNISKADTAPSAQEKLLHYLEMHRTIGSSISMWSNTPAGANEIMPLVVYIIVKAAPKQFISILK